MLVLFESASGYALFKLLDESKLSEADNVWKDFESPEKAQQILKLVSFKAFKDTTEALQATTNLIEGKLGKGLKKILKKCTASDAHDELAVADAKLGSLIKEKMEIQCVNNSAIAELMRGIRSQMDSLITELPKKDLLAMSLGLAHSLSRYKLKFSPEKVDTMIIQAISLLDDLDKELNNYVMRCREWYGWHFPELGKILQDHQAYSKVVNLVGVRQNVKTTDLSDLLPEDLETQVKEAAEISMGTDISELDIFNIRQLCNQIIEICSYRTQLYEYLKNRMMSLAPNLTILLGELVGARLISHAGSLMNLAKYPASTVQILGAEKALFRALKTKKDTPKYGLLYHAQLVGQAPGKLKGKMSRMLAAKSALACRVDALGEDNDTELGVKHKAYLEGRIKVLQEQGTSRISGTGRQTAKLESYKFKSEVLPYNAGDDSTIPSAKKRRFDGSGDASEEVKKEEEEEEVKTPKKKKIKLETPEETAATPNGTAEVNGDPEETESSEKKKKKKKRKSKAADEDE